MTSQLDRNEILNAINRELYLQVKFIELRVTSRQRDEKLWRLTIERVDDFSQLDESLEGSEAWWSEPKKGIADVLAVIPEEGQIILRYASTTPPDTGQKILIYPPNYLEALRDTWNDIYWFERIVKKYVILKDFSLKTDTCCLLEAASHVRLNWLRGDQKECFRLLDYACSFLWGPPGTGKTTSLGVLLSEYLLHFPDAKILLLSTTNVAVDEALVSVDKALEKIHANSQRGKIKRIGSHFRPEYYRGRQHLLPSQDEGLLEAMIRLENTRPETDDIQAYAAWKAQKESLQQQMKKRTRDLIRDVRLCAMTATRAIFQLDILTEFCPFNLIVFDEASQVSRAHALALAPLGKKVIYAGDPKQLAPIVKASQPDALKWLGESMFYYMNLESASTVMLTEQSRMVEQICKIISNIFYHGKLIVAKDKLRDTIWLREREFPQVPKIRAINLLPIEKDGVWSQKFGGYIRFDSAQEIECLVSRLLAQGVESSKIAVLTPFRAQRRLIRLMHKNNGIKGVLVSTVHRVQGSERDIVIFDPVCGASDFLTSDNGRRLINVAISRAKAIVFLLLSEVDKQNAVFAQIERIVTFAGNSEKPIPLKTALLSRNFPEDFIGKFVEFSSCIGKVVGVEREGNDSKVKVLDIESGKEIKYSVRILKERFCHDNIAK